jgi:hypothetical protein
MASLIDDDRRTFENCMQQELVEGSTEISKARLCSISF